MKILNLPVCALLSVLPFSLVSKETYENYNLNGKIYQKGWIDFNKNGVKDIYEDSSQPINLRVEDLLSQMNNDEKTCQMVTLYGYGRVLKDDLPNETWKEQLWKDGIGAIDEHLNGFQQWGLPPSSNEYVWPASKHAWALNEVQRFFVEQTRLGIPTDFTNEGIRGVESYIATNFPTQLGIGHTWNRALVRELGRITGSEARALGYTNIYAPVLDVGRDQRWGRYEEVYGESPFLVAELGIEMTKGLQDRYQVASTAKHFIAYSNNKGAREGMARTDPQMSPREVEMVHVYPFKRVIKEAGSLGVMSSYNDYNSEPIQSSKYWLTERLRGEMGFKGYVVSDSDAVEYLHSKHGVAEDMKESVRQSVEAGLNVRCTFRSPDSFVLPLRELIQEGAISQSVIDDRVRDVLRVKFLVGLFDMPYTLNLKKSDEIVNSLEHQKIALQASHESIVLLKNEKNILPLDDKKIKNIAIIGPNADESSFALTHYGPLAVEVTTLFEGVKNRVENCGVNVSYEKGCELVDDNWPDSEIEEFEMTAKEIEMIEKAVKLVNNSDVAIIALGGGQRTCGENKSRTDITLPGRQLELLKAVKLTGKPVVLVLINGRPLAINWANKNVDAILEAWYPGSQGGKALANVIFGDYNPGGKLTVTFPKSVGQIPFNFPARPGSQADGYSGLGVKGWQSRVNGGLYPFGFGLSYTQFEYSDLELSSDVITANQSVDVSFKLKNTGDRDGDEVVQLYVRDIVSSVVTYEKSLRGFERIHLKKGEEKRVTMTLNISDLALLNRNNEWVVEDGEFKIMIGRSSVDIPLSTTLNVVDAKKRALIISERKSSSNTVWRGKKGDFTTLSLAHNSAPSEVLINWKEPVLNSKFEIQVSSGGGQFLTLYRGDVVSGVNNYKIKSSISSDLRVVITEGEATISELVVK